MISTARFRFRLAVGLVLGAFTLAAAAPLAASSPFAPLPAQPPIPKDNPQTPAKIELGKQLFFDPRLSSTGVISCNTCHNVMAGGDDQRATSFGVHGKLGPRNAPTVWNAAYLSAQFWDGREPTLEAQAKGPIVNPIEMGMPSHDPAVERIRAIPGYVEAFRKVFGGKDSVTIDNIAKAIAAYERTLVTPGAPFDQFLEGKKRAISKEARRGMELFQSTGCVACHSGALLAGPDLPMGTGFFQRFPTMADDPYVAQYKLAEDLGRFDVTGEEGDKHMFRVPTLRNIELTAPYFHNGSVATLDEAVRVMARVQLGQTLEDKDVAAIVEFLRTLTGPFPEQTMPRLPGTSGTTLIRE